MRAIYPEGREEYGSGREPGGTVLKYLSVCSGIEAASCAWEHLGWNPVGFSEIEPFPSAVLTHRFPSVKNYGDMTKYKEWNDVGKFDVLVGGTPCQSFSVAGLRKGLNDPRGNLMLIFGAIADHFRPRWIVWENVPGVLSSNGGRDFGSFLGMLGELGYGVAYRILDAQYFGVAQRRRRVFVVGHLGDWRRSAQVLFESESLCGYPAPSRETREGIAGTAAQCFEPRSPDGCARLVGDIAPTLNRMGGGQREPCIMSTGQGNAEITEGHAPTLTAHSQKEAPILAVNGFCWQNGFGIDGNGDLSGTLIKNQTPAAQIGSSVRRLTPRECERLQGFPDDWTRIPWRGASAENCPDGPRYKACGNSMAVPVMKWIGERIKKTEESK